MAKKKRGRKTASTKYYYRPRTYRSPEASYWYRRLLIVVSLIFLIVIVAWFWGLTLLSNLDRFWGTFRRVEDEPAPRQDILSPLPPKLNSLPQATNKATVTISGFSEPGSKVKLFLNDSLQEQRLADREGTFAFEENPLEKGENYIYLTATDVAGNESEPTKTYTVTFDEKAPEIHIEEPEDGQKFKGKDEKTIKITGMISKNATLTINETKVIVNEDGEFIFYLTLKEGGNTIKFEATDAAGNKSEEELNVIYTAGES